MPPARWVERTSFLAVVLAPPQCPLGATEHAPDPANVFGTASCGDLGWNVAGAADAKESTAIRETRELKEEFFRIPKCAY